MPFEIAEIFSNVAGESRSAFYGTPNSRVGAAIPNDYCVLPIYPFPLNSLGISRHDFQVTQAGFSATTKPCFVTLKITDADELVEVALD